MSTNSTFRSKFTPEEWKKYMQDARDKFRAKFTDEEWKEYQHNVYLKGFGKGRKHHTGIPKTEEEIKEYRHIMYLNSKNGQGP